MTTAWTVVFVLGLIAAFCIGREWSPRRPPNLKRIKPRGYRQW